MSKRRAGIQLTKDNCDRESDDEVESLSAPQMADSETLKSRPIVKAKRRLENTSNEENEKSGGLFSGFKGGFGSSGKFTFGTSPFALTTNSTLTSGNSTFGSSTFCVPKFGTNIPVNKTNDNVNVSSTNDENDSFSSYLEKLNRDFYSHIKKYMDSSKLYDFTVVCEGYIEHIKKFTKNENSEKPKTSSTEVNNNKPGLFNFGKTSSLSPFGSNSLGNNFIFGAASNSLSNNGLFGKNLTKFSTSIKNEETKESTTETNTDGGGDGNESDVPPKVVSVQHTESDAVYSKKCKLYFQKDGSYVEKGVGFLYIKTSNSRPQLLIRADTTTGNILLNISLVDSLPVSKADGNKGVMLTCIPNPELETKKDDKKQSVTFLIRVKPVDCDELYESIVKYKSQS